MGVSLSILTDACNVQIMPSISLFLVLDGFACCLCCCRNREASITPLDKLGLVAGPAAFWFPHSSLVTPLAIGSIIWDKITHCKLCAKMQAGQSTMKVLHGDKQWLFLMSQ